MVTTSRAENLTAFAEVIQVINSSLEIDEVLRFVMDSIIRLTNAERGFLMLRDGHGELVTQIARNWEQESVHESEYAISRTIINKVVKEGEPIITLNAQEDPRFGGQESIIMYSLRSILCVPLMVKGELIGVLYTDNRVQSGIFSDEDKDLLVAFGNQAAVALENARLFDHAQRNLRRTQALREIDQTIAGSIDMQKVLQDVVDQIMCELGLDAAAVLLFDTKEQKLKYEIGYGLRTEALFPAGINCGSSTGHRYGRAARPGLSDVPSRSARRRAPRNNHHQRGKTAERRNAPSRSSPGGGGGRALCPGRPPPHHHWSGGERPRGGGGAGGLFRVLCYPRGDGDEQPVPEFPYSPSATPRF